MAKTKSVFSNDDPMAKIRLYLMKKLPFFGVLIHKLVPVAKDAKWFESIGAKGSPMATDGRSLMYDPVAFGNMSEQERCFVVAHEIMHNAYGHFMRRGNRDPFLSNCAQDYVINLMLMDDAKATQEDSGGSKIDWVMPQMGLLDEKYRGLVWEQVYDMLLQDRKQQLQKLLDEGKIQLVGWAMDGSGKDNPDNKQDGEGQGQGMTLTPGEVEQLDAQWKVAAEQAASAARQADKSSAGVDRLIDTNRQPKHNWKQQLRDYFTVPGDYTWAKPSRRYIGEGMYLPSVKQSKLGHIVFVMDASGSIDREMMSEVGSEIKGAIDAAGEWPQRVTVMCHDSVVTSVEDMEEGDFALHPKGGGGTAFQPVFDYVSEQEWTPQVMFYFTDLCSSDKPQKPSGYPVVWLAKEEYSQYFQANVGWGELIELPRSEG